jgi:extracellular factor (EF) 3-hydroxypalmitic acid methyl ester biosynthesis protein
MTEELVIRFPQSILKEGPQPEDYPFTNHFFMRQYQKDKEGFTQLFSHVRQDVKAFHSLDSVAGFCYQQPHGYAGDFEMIERLYTRYVSPDSSLAKWDRFAQAQPAAKAVRNRKKYFIDLMQSGPYNKVLNLASGPCRDLKEYFDQHPDSGVKVDCVELDQNAIAYAQELLGNNNNVRFIHQNVLRLHTEETYDLIWSAGLFDYFNDRIFIYVLSRLLRNLKKGGELVIGNFSDTNPNRAFMEVAMNWHLHHRSEKQLINLALKAGAHHHDLWVCHESEGVNLFLHIKDNC